jgi:hypothetical protein
VVAQGGKDSRFIIYLYLYIHVVIFIIDQLKNG